ncbi:MULTISPECIES: hypothetical protein [unclassified Nocardiopsis]|uniref:hypothetical protein n=1 Tax=unclassified Nocardiopsis TaxID=2649073 RepID=UPI00066D8510|nr:MULTISPECIES: hypothetical protein [unclassified Nocardiopsis]MBQ1084600.1 hypothetical protein [Nocardiopsis sp. B62]
MATSDDSGNRRRSAPEDEDPTAAVPEADAAEQRVRADADADEGREDWTERAAGESFDQADEADVIEQVREAGQDEEERR